MASSISSVSLLPLQNDTSLKAILILLGSGEHMLQNVDINRRIRVTIFVHSSQLAAVQYRLGRQLL